MGFGLGSLGNLLGATLDSVKVSVLGHDGLVDAHVGAAKGVAGGLDAHTGNDHHGWHC
jgi:hypothetical protein